MTRYTCDCGCNFMLENDWGARKVERVYCDRCWAESVVQYGRDCRAGGFAVPFLPKADVETLKAIAEGRHAVRYLDAIIAKLEAAA
jgi:hypothetical protein